MKTKDYWVNKLGEGWTMALRNLLKSKYMDKLEMFLAIEYSMKKVFPEDYSTIFNSLKLFPYEKLKVVIIGEEPAPSYGTGPLAFSDASTISTNCCATAIRNSFPDLHLGFDTSFSPWAEQGVLMLNRSLTCLQNEPKSHKLQWKKFFGSILLHILVEKPNVIFLLWGEEAQKYAPFLESHAVFTRDSPYEYGKMGTNWHCPNFEQVNILLEQMHGGTDNNIQW